MKDNRVVIEYRFKGYSEPEGAKADFLPCQVVHGIAGVNLGEFLSDVRGNLGLEGYEFAGVEIVEKYDSGHRWYPKWREVWRPQVKSEKMCCASGGFGRRFILSRG